MRRTLREYACGCSPRAIRPGAIGPCTLVATTISSRFAISPSHRPVTSSLTPTEYTFAVSKKLIPDFECGREMLARFVHR